VRFRVEWWYADGHGVATVFAEDSESAIAKFWRRFGEFLPMAYKRAVATPEGEG
jgi:hypothetical protein